MEPPSNWPRNRILLALTFRNLKRLCETHLTNRYEIEIVDLLEHPRLARGDEIIAIPTLVRQLPPPMRGRGLGWR